MKKYLTSLNLIFALEIIIIVLASIGLIPREVILVLTGLIIFYFIFSPLEDALWLTVASIPLFAALPLSEGFDTLANWRILIAVLFLCLFFKQGISISRQRGLDGRVCFKENLQRYGVEYFILALLLISFISVFAAEFKFVAAKKLLFLINIFLLFLITRNFARSKQLIVRVWQAAAIGGAIVTVVSVVQFFAVWFAPLFSFWQFWAKKVISVFYGQSLAGLLGYTNTWFAYYPGSPPTLRLFSVFPDSHSLAMFNIILIPVYLALALFFGQSVRQRRFYWILSALALAQVIFTGSRGAWLTILPIIVVVVYTYFKKLEPVLVKKIFSGLAIFAVIFMISQFYPPFFYRIQAWQSGQDASSTFAFFSRVKSISDADEISNKGRLEIWRASANSIIKHPFFGVGLGNYAIVLNQGVETAKQGASAHNLYLDFAAETGVFGLVALIAVFANILYTGWLIFRRANDRHFKFYGLLVFLFLLWVAAYSFFDVVLLNDKVFLTLMVVLATLYNIRNIEFKPEKI